MILYGFCIFADMIKDSKNNRDQVLQILEMQKG